ncbi:MAG: hypothetical protein WEB60_09670 [Terrimicrobiaceae bacterium]
MIRVLLSVLVVSSFVGCSTIEEFNTKRYDNHNALGDAWLSDQMEPPMIDISGSYKSDDWGRSYFSQNGSNVRGHLGDYPVKGVVSGNKAYLLVTEGGWYYYSAIVEMPRPGLLTGYYSRSIPYKRSARRDLLLVTTD